MLSFPFMQGLKDAQGTQIKEVFRLAKGAVECSELLYPPLSFLFPLQTDGKQASGSRAANVQEKWHCPQGTQPQNEELPI